MGRLRIGTQGIPATPALNSIEVFPHSFDKRLYAINDAGMVEILENGIAALAANVTVTAAGNIVIMGGTTIPIPANVLSAGSTFRVTLIGTFTGTATATAIRVHLGTAGTTADAIIFTASVTGAVGTSLAKIVIEFTLRTIGAAGTLAGFMNIWQHAAAAVGIANTGTSIILGTTTTAPNTTNNNFITVSILSAAGGTSGTVNNAFVEVVK